MAKTNNGERRPAGINDTDYNIGVTTLAAMRAMEEKNLKTTGKNEQSVRYEVATSVDLREGMSIVAEDTKLKGEDR